MFVDHVKIYVRAGDGGDGKVSFRREKYVAAGGPDGGDGGRGGNIVLQIHEGTNTLLSFRYKRKFIAENGGGGEACKRHGKNGEDVIISIPNGTIVRDAESGKIIKDMSNCEPFILCKGGRGGWGNRHFATPTRQIPKFAKGGTKGEEREVLLELKMLADVGLVGFPNVGKSSLISRISAAKPKVANYHFTTLSPSLGVVSTGEGKGFVVADIPGLIEGASDGLGLGHEFLRHVDRCRLLLHVVDVSGLEGRDPIDDIEKIDAELAKYSEELSSRPQIIVANKSDMIEAGTTDIAALEKYVAETGRKLIYISALNGENLDKLVRMTEEELSDLPPLTIYEAEYIPEEEVVSTGERTTEIRRENDTFFVEGEWLYNLMGQINTDDYESLSFFSRVLQKAGVIEMLEEKGCTDGHTVNIYGFEFDFVK